MSRMVILKLTELNSTDRHRFPDIYMYIYIVHTGNVQKRISEIYINRYQTSFFVDVVTSVKGVAIDVIQKYKGEIIPPKS